jgi:hypothetical protein
MLSRTGLGRTGNVNKFIDFDFERNHIRGKFYVILSHVFSLVNSSPQIKSISVCYAANLGLDIWLNTANVLLQLQQIC